MFKKYDNINSCWDYGRTETSVSYWKPNCTGHYLAELTYVCPQPSNYCPGYIHKKKVKVKVSQLCLTLCDPMDYTVHGILQARILEWGAFPVSKRSSQPRNRTKVDQWSLDTYIRMFIATSFIMAKFWKQFKYWSIGERITFLFI